MLSRDEKRLTNIARRGYPRRAFSLLELTAVVAILGVFAGMGVMRFGHSGVTTLDTNGFVRKFVLDLNQARWRTISTGDTHTIAVNIAGGKVVGYTLYRVTPSGLVAIDNPVPLPKNTTFVAGDTNWTFSFDGSIGGFGSSGSIAIADANYTWNIVTYYATGKAAVTKTPTP